MVPLMGCIILSHLMSPLVVLHGIVLYPVASHSVAPSLLPLDAIAFIL